MTKRPRLSCLKPQIQTLAPRLRVLTTRPGATPRLSDRSGYAWAKIRERILARDVLCVYCQAATPPRVSASVEVDHRIPLSQGGTDDEDNLAGTCVPCHRAKSAREQGRG